MALVDIEDDIDTDWSIFSRPVQLPSYWAGWEPAAAGPVVYFTPALHHHYEMSSQAHHDALRSGGGAGSWPNITTLDSSLVINITPYTTSQHHTLTLLEIHVITLKSLSVYCIHSKYCRVNILQSFSLPSLQSMNEWNKHFPEEGERTVLAGQWRVGSQCLSGPSSLCHQDKIHLWAGKSRLTVNINSNPTNGPKDL